MKELTLLEIIAINIKKIRISQNISQEELAFRCNVSKNYLSDIERGTRNITVNIIEKIIKGLNISINELFAVRN
ncbi:helix-turn-helix domain-containing protein [Mesoplasma corruscae]|uniref:Transcriptional regulator n=1 Tax=Mesoplasma corruscae TaxID=216874 RepID=A0A2S5RH36_9MOLU|nr:helix-turn-helix transcriptional regulator [Mesoplasma corruscae]PPE06608.1 transcriptional regulator [Mesoplasma corruscae]